MMDLELKWILFLWKKDGSGVKMGLLPLKKMENLDNDLILAVGVRVMFQIYGLIEDLSMVASC